jgi:hypothetical protein
MIVCSECYDALNAEAEIGYYACTDSDFPIDILISLERIKRWKKSKGRTCRQQRPDRTAHGELPGRKGRVGKINSCELALPQQEPVQPWSVRHR